jgi:Fe-Mn family superoxide dismutase
MNTYTPKIFVSNTYKEQTFDLHGLDGISDDQIREHLALYAGYVERVNVLNEQLTAMTGRGQALVKDREFGDLTRHLGFEYNGKILHECYFSNLRPAADPKPSSGSSSAAPLAGTHRQ